MGRVGKLQECNCFGGGGMAFIRYCDSGGNRGLFRVEAGDSSCWCGGRIL